MSLPTKMCFTYFLCGLAFFFQCFVLTFPTGSHFVTLLVGYLWPHTWLAPPLCRHPCFYFKPFRPSSAPVCYLCFYFLFFYFSLCFLGGERAKFNTLVVTCVALGFFYIFFKIAKTAQLPHPSCVSLWRPCCAFLWQRFFLISFFMPGSKARI